MPSLTEYEHPAARGWAEVDARAVEDRCGGVPVFWADMPPPRRAQLMFRVGRADEPFSRGGISHLVEHLTLSTLGDRIYGYNGSVSGDVTTFSVGGTDADVVEFLGLVCAALRRLPLDRLEAERTVLLTEAARRTSEALPVLLAVRYGWTGMGLLGAEELGLRAATGEEVQAWADQCFTAANAALVLTGPPPRGLAIDLPPGVQCGDALSEPVAQPLPTGFRRSSAVVAFGSTMPRGRSGNSAFHRHLQRAMTQRLRVELGITYSVAVVPLRIDADTDHVVVTADALAEQAAAVNSAMLGELDRLAEHGVDAADLERDLEQTRRAAEVPDAVGASLIGRAMAALNAEPYASLAGRAQHLTMLSAADVAGMAADLRDNAIWMVPEEASLAAGRFKTYVGWSPAPVRADRYLKPRVAAQGPNATLGLAIGEQGVSLVISGSRFVTVRWEECVGAQSWSTGQWALYSKDGFRLNLDPAGFDGSAEIQRLIEEHVPPQRRVHMGEMPASPAAAPARRQRSRWARLLPFGVLVGPAALAVISWTNLQTTQPAPTSPVIPQIRIDPATNDITLVPSTPQAQPAPQPSTDPGNLAVAIVATGATVALGTRIATRRRR